MDSPEVHIIGSIIGGSDFEYDSTFCCYEVICQPLWECIAGELTGQTQASSQDSEKLYVWDHPIDLHFFTETLQGWPKMILKLWNIDWFGTKQLFGYSLCDIPSTSGIHELTFPVWRVCGTSSEEISHYFINTSTVLKNSQPVYATAKDDRCRLITRPSGKVHLSFSIILRNFHHHDALLS